MQEGIKKLKSGVTSSLPLVVTRAGTVAAAFSLHLLISRALPIDEAGLVFAVLAWVAVSSIFARFGLETYLVRIFAQESERRTPISAVGKLYLTVIVSSLVAALIIWCALEKPVAVGSYHILVGSLSVIPYTVSIVSGAILKHFRWGAIANLVEGGGGGVVAVAILAAYTTGTEDSVTANFILFIIFSSYLLFGALISALSFSLIVLDNRKKSQKELPESALSFCRTRDLVRASIPYMIPSGMGYALIWLPAIALSTFGRYDEVAYFNVVVRLGALLTFGLSAINVLAAPKIAKLYVTGDVDGVQRVATTTANSSTFFATITILLLASLGDWTLQLFGNQHAISFWPLMIFCSGQLVNAATGAAAYLLQMAGSAEVVSKINAVVFFTVGLSAAIAAVIASYSYAIALCAIAIGLQNILYLKAAARLYGIRSWPSFSN